MENYTVVEVNGNAYLKRSGVFLSAKEDPVVPADHPVVIKRQDDGEKDAGRKYTHFVALPITNPQTRDRLRFLRDTLKAQQHRPQSIIFENEPHFTLLLVTADRSEVVRAKSAFQDAVARIKQLDGVRNELELDHLSTFKGADATRVVFAAPSNSVTLLSEMNKILVQEFSRHNVKVSAEMTPHVTLAKVGHFPGASQSIDAERFLGEFQKVSVGKFVPGKLELLALGKKRSGYWPVIDTMEL